MCHFPLNPQCTLPGIKHARQEQQQATANMALVIKPERGAEIKILPTSQIGCETQENLQTKHLLLSQIMVHSIEAKKSDDLSVLNY